MAKKKTPPPVEFPSGEILAELKTLLKVKGAKKRAASAWPLLLQAAPNSDFPVVMDFALENGLAHSLDAQQTMNGQPVLSTSWTSPVDGLEMIWIPPGPFCIGSKKTR